MSHTQQKKTKIKQKNRKVALENTSIRFLSLRILQSDGK